jgi:hypothetical protein
MKNKQLYANVKAAFVAKHSSLHKWSLEHGICRQNVRAALLGEWTGPKATELLTKILKETGLEGNDHGN